MIYFVVTKAMKHILASIYGYYIAILGYMVKADLMVPENSSIFHLSFCIFHMKNCFSCLSYDALLVLNLNSILIFFFADAGQCLQPADAGLSTQYIAFKSQIVDD